MHSTHGIILFHLLAYNHCNEIRNITSLQTGKLDKNKNAGEVEGVDISLAPLRKLAHAINRDFLALKIENFQLKNVDIFLIFAQNIDCGYTLEPPRRGGSNEYPQSMFWSKNKKNRYTPANPSFSIYKVGFKGVYITRTCYPDAGQNTCC